MTTYILKTYANDSLWWDSCLEMSVPFAVGSDRNYWTGACSWTCSDNRLSDVLTAFNSFSGYGEDVEWFMESCDVKINANRTQFYKALTSCRDDADNACNVLNLIFGGSWKYTTLRGCSQGDWCDCIYNSDKVSDDMLSYIEACYFGTGYELGIIENTDKEPSGIDFSDVDYWDYTDKWSDDDIKTWCNLPEAVVLEDHESTVTVHSFY